MQDIAHLLDKLEEVGGRQPTPLKIVDSTALNEQLLRWRIPIRTKWGKGRAKTVKTLYDQLVTDKEALLYETVYMRRVRGLLYRRVLTCWMAYDVPRNEVAYDWSPYAYENGTVVHKKPHEIVPRPLTGRLLLTEYQQAFGVGSFEPAKHPRNISETIGFEETDINAVFVRLWMEEFGFPPSERELASIVYSPEIIEDIASGDYGRYDPGIPMADDFVRDQSGDSTKYPGLLSIKDLIGYIMLMYDHFNPDGYIEVKPDKTIVFKWVPITQLTSATE